MNVKPCDFYSWMSDMEVRWKYSRIMELRIITLDFRVALKISLLEDKGFDGQMWEEYRGYVVSYQVLNFYEYWSYQKVLVE